MMSHVSPLHTAALLGDAPRRGARLRLAAGQHLHASQARTERMREASPVLRVDDVLKRKQF